MAFDGKVLLRFVTLIDYKEKNDDQLCDYDNADDGTPYMIW